MGSPDDLRSEFRENRRRKSGTTLESGPAPPARDADHHYRRLQRCRPKGDRRIDVQLGNRLAILSRLHNASEHDERPPWRSCDGPRSFGTASRGRVGTRRVRLAEIARRRKRRALSHGVAVIAWDQPNHKMTLGVKPHVSQVKPCWLAQLMKRAFARGAEQRPPPVSVAERRKTTKESSLAHFVGTGKHFRQCCERSPQEETTT